MCFIMITVNVIMVLRTLFVRSIVDEPEILFVLMHTRIHARTAQHNTHARMRTKPCSSLRQAREENDRSQLFCQCAGLVKQSG